MNPEMDLFLKRRMFHYGVTEGFSLEQIKQSLELKNAEFELFMSELRSMLQLQ